MIFSFYLSDKITSLAINKNPIMEQINETSKTLTVMGTNATIEDNTIIPGISGKKVDKEASFFKMKEFGAFNEMFLVYENIKPNISLEDNKDKIIIQGNKGLRQVSIIIDDNETLTTSADYCFKNSIRTLEGMNSVLQKFYKNGVVTGNSLNQYMENSIKNYTNTVVYVRINNTSNWKLKCGNCIVY